MNTIIREYGRGLLAAAAAVLVFGLIFSSALGVGDRGVSDAAGKVFAAAHETDAGMERADASSDEASKRQLPVIRSHPICRTGVAYAYKDIFVNDEGEPFESVRVLEIMVMGNGEMREPSDTEVSADSGRITFKDEGLYRMRIAAVDDKGVINSASFYIGVER